MNFPEQFEKHKKVFSFRKGTETIIETSYDTLNEGDLFFVSLKTGGFSLLTKTDEFYDELITNIESRKEAESLLREYSKNKE